MATVILTAKGFRHLRALNGKRTDYRDTKLTGLVLRVTPTGIRTWCCVYRVGRRLRRMTIGSFPPMGLAKARRVAAGALLEASLGRDPASTKLAARQAQTVGELWTLYLTKHAKPKKKSWRQDASLWRRCLQQPLQHVTIPAVTRPDIRRIITAIADRGAPILANRVLALIRKMLNFAVEQDLLVVNPAQHIPRPGQEHRRDRVLTDDELRTIWTALEREDAVTRDVYGLRLLTAQRGGEIVRMKWRDLDLTEKNPWWTIPGEDAKNGLPHRVPLSGLAYRIIKARRALVPEECRWVFPSSDALVPATQMIRGSASRIGRNAGVPDFVGHDLRRTAATAMTSAGISRLVVGKVLNHAEPGVTAVYDRSSYDAEKRDALDRWGAILEALLKAKPDNQ